MRVLHVTPAYYPATYWGGPIFSVFALNNALAQLTDVSLTVLTTDAAGPRPADRLEPADLLGLYPNQRVEIMPRLAGASVSLAMLGKLPALVRKADVVHLTAAYSFPTLPTLLLCRLFGKPLVWSPRGAIQDAHEWAGARHRRLKRLWERACNLLMPPGRMLVHVTAERERAATQARLPRLAAVVVPNGVDTPEALPARQWRPGGRLRLMYLGRLSPKKGIENLLAAVSLLRGMDISLAIHGTGEAGYVAELKGLAGRGGLPAGAVHFTGHVDGEAKAAAFANADVCVVPSHSENFCMVVAEALAHGVPVVTSKGTPWQAVEDRQCGLWVDNDPRSLADAIAKIGQSDLATMGSLGHAWMRTEFDWDSIARAMHRVYERVLEARP